MIGNGKEGKIRELIDLFDRKSKIESLVQEIIKEIPEMAPVIEKLRESIGESCTKYYHPQDNNLSEGVPINMESARKMLPMFYSFPLIRH